MSAATTEIIEGFAAIATRYDALLIDLWGVTHNGRALFAEAVEVFRAARAAGKRLVFLSNAPRRQASVVRQLERFGLDAALYDGVVTSGEVAWAWIGSDAGRAALGGAGRAYHLGAGVKDANMREGLAVRFTEDVAAMDQVDFILNTGPAAGARALETFQPVLDAGAARGLPMICANPDLSVVRGEVEELCAGALAQAYEATGGRVYWFGKPWAEVYARCRDELSALGVIDPARVLCIGDSFRTDIGGAHNAGLDSLLVATGLRRTDLLDASGKAVSADGLAVLARDYGVAPTYACVALRP